VLELPQRGRLCARLNARRSKATQFLTPPSGASAQRKISFTSQGEPLHSTVCYGPYIKLPAGTYVAKLCGEVKGQFEVMFTANTGERTIANQVVHSTREALSFRLPVDADRFEVVIRTTRDSRALNLDAVELLRFTEGDFASTGLLPAPFYELRYLQTEPAATNPGVVRGRNCQRRGNSDAPLAVVAETDPPGRLMRWSGAEGVARSSRPARRSYLSVAVTFLAAWPAFRLSFRR
jgi:hypothetical protein